MESPDWGRESERENIIPGSQTPTETLAANISVCHSSPSHQLMPQDSMRSTGLAHQECSVNSEDMLQGEVTQIGLSSTPNSRHHAQMSCGETQGMVELTLSPEQLEQKVSSFESESSPDWTTCPGQEMRSSQPDDPTSLNTLQCPHNTAAQTTACADADFQPSSAGFQPGSKECCSPNQEVFHETESGPGVTSSECANPYLQLLTKEVEHVINTQSSESSVNVPQYSEHVQMDCQYSEDVIDSEHSEQVVLESCPAEQVVTDSKGSEVLKEQSKESISESFGSETGEAEIDQEAVRYYKQCAGKLSSDIGARSGTKLLAMCREEFSRSKENFLRGCKWSPDGRVLLSNSNDNRLRLFQIPEAILGGHWNVQNELGSTVCIKETDLVYDFCWYPGVSSSEAKSNVFVTSARDAPVHLYSGETGELLCSYRPYNDLDEIVSPHSLGFAGEGKYLLTGCNKAIRCFHTNRPGRQCSVFKTLEPIKDRKSGKRIGATGQRGIISCFAAHPLMPSLVAAGAFSGDVALYDVEQSGCMQMMFEGLRGGVTHLLYSKDGTKLFVGGRKDPEIICYDMRMAGKVLFAVYRYVATNQRMYFDLDKSERYLLSGHHNGQVSVWDVQGHTYQHHLSPWVQMNPVSGFRAHQDTVNGCSVNPAYPILATCSGQRHFPIPMLDDDELMTCFDNDPLEENAIKLWTLTLP